MMKDIKLGCKLLKYGLNVKGCIVSLVLCFVLVVFMELVFPIAALSSLWIGMGAAVVVQLVHSISVSQMVQTSPYKNKLQTTIPTLIVGGYMLIAHTLSLILKWIGYQRIMRMSDPDFIIEFEPYEFSNAIIWAGFFMVFIELFMGLSMKCFWVATVIFGAVFVWFYMGMNGVEMVYFAIPEPLAVALSYVIILGGCGFMYLIFCLTYKKDYHRMTFETALKRAS